MRRDFYARRLKSSVWHFHRECPQYPPNDGSVFKAKRPQGKLCKKCLALERATPRPSATWKLSAPSF